MPLGHGMAAILVLAMTGNGYLIVTDCLHLSDIFQHIIAESNHCIFSQRGHSFRRALKARDMP